MSGAQSSEMHLEAEAKKRQKEDRTPLPMERQAKTKKNAEQAPKENDSTERDLENTTRELFPATPTSYKSFYTKEHKTGKEPRWKQQQATIEERTMQAKTPQTAKKQTDSSNDATDLSKQLAEQIQEAQATMAKMQAAMDSTEQPPYVHEMQQQILNLQQSLQDMQKQSEDLGNDIRDVDILTQHVHDALYLQQQREVAKQTVAKGWPKEFTDEERDNVISWYLRRAGVEENCTTTHGRYMHGRYRQSPVTILHWKSESAKHAFETHIYKRYNKQFPVTIWDTNNKTVYFGNQPHRISFTPQTSDMERDLNLTIKAALHILTNHEASNLAKTWNKIAVKWQDKLAVRVADNAVLFKLLRDKDDSKYMFLHIHKDYFDITNDNWKQGWEEANSNTKHPNYNNYPYMLKFAILRSNEEYYTMRDARWNEKQGDDESWLGAPHERAEVTRKELEKKELGKKELGRKRVQKRFQQRAYTWKKPDRIKTLYLQEVCRDPHRSSAGSENPPTPFPTTKVHKPQSKKNRKRAERRRLWRCFKHLYGKVRPTKAQETKHAQVQRKDMKAAFKSFFTETCKRTDDPPKSHKSKGHKLPYGVPLKVATLNIRGLNGENGITKRQHIGKIMRSEGLDILLLTETQVNTSSIEIHNEFTFFFSSDVQPGKSEREHAGVGIVMHRKLKPFVYEIKQTNGRLMAMKLRAKGMNIAFVCCYAPHSGHLTETKESFYDSLQNLINELKDVVHIGGDFNARLQHRYNNETNILGPHIFGRGRAYLEGVSTGTRENRDMFVDFCTANDLRVMNTDFQKPLSQLVTFRENTTKIGDPFAPDKYAQLDYWLTKCRHKNQCMNVQSRTDIYLDTDHYMLEMSVRMQLAAPRVATEHKASRFAKPSNIVWHHYNRSVSNLYRTSLQSQDDEKWKLFNSAIQAAAKKNLSKDTPPPKKDYLSQHTWNLIKSRQNFYEQGLHDEVKTLDRQIKQNARSDRKRQVVNQFQYNPLDPHKRKMWKTVNHLRKDFKPSYISMRDENGRLVPLKERAETIATYLEEHHWHNECGQGPLPNPTPIGDAIDCHSDPFDLEELHAVLKRCKVNKQPGPDCIVAELYKWLNRENRLFLLEILNQWWAGTQVPPELLLARVVPIYKKGDIDDPSNYRPISLLNSMYKIYASLIRNRIQRAVECKVTSTQYGFRPNRSTAHATYLIRRLQDWSEQKNASFYLALIDWEKAFDKVQHSKLVDSMSRLGFSDHFIDSIRSIYQSPTFYVQDAYGRSQIKI